ncbi:MAG: aldehyde ferredoxin oxidoreductase family protein [Deltaproteobacteria bacterium]|nr:aldehyde ferredoxin oxidoreductase family protein [Deltaproteobacteria bacterium]
MTLVWPLGRVLWIDLSRREFHFTALDEEEVLRWLGGRGFVARILSDRLKPETGYYAPENPIVFAIGPLTGTKAPVAGRFVAGARSPLTGGYGMSVSGSEFGPAMRWCGLHAIVISGTSGEPVAVSIQDDRVTFRDASRLWGRDTFETQDILKQELQDPKAQISCIGPAGENLVRFSAVISGRRAAARCGVGAVMGSKKLKAIALSRIPKGDYQVARSGEFDRVAKEAYRALVEHPVGKIMKTLGSSFTVDVVNEAGILPTRNFQEGVFEHAKRISGQRLKDEFRVRRTASCYRCPVTCESEVRVDRGEYAGASTRGLEYETLFALGSNCGNANLESIIFMDMYCDMMGLDTMSLGVTISFAMECFERGLISERETGGLDLSWGNHRVLKDLADLIVQRRGFGAVLADGVARASKKIRGSQGYAMHVKGLEMGGYDPRGAKGQGLSFATSTRGGCHHAGGYIVGPEVLTSAVDRFATEGKAQLVKECRNSRVIYDSAILCTFNTGALGWYLAGRLLSAAIGTDLSEEELKKTGDRIFNTEREINQRFGIGPSRDTLPERFLREPMPSGPSQGQTVELEEMLEDYYAINGWQKE